MVKPSTIRIVEKALRLVQFALLGAIAWAVVLAVRPVHVDDFRPHSANTTKSDETAPEIATNSSLKPLEWYEPLWTRDLRQPPIPPVATPKPFATPKPIPMPPLPKLMGTFVEGDNAWAHLMSREVGVRVLQLHAGIDEFTISAIEPGRVELSWRDQTRWLEIERPKNAIAQRP